MPSEFLGVKPAVKIGSTGLWAGTGTPEAVVTAPVGDIFLRTDGAAMTAMYVKESGTGNTGWRRLVTLDGNADLSLPDDLLMVVGKNLAATTGIADARLVIGDTSAGYAFYMSRNLADSGVVLYINQGNASGTGPQIMFQKAGANNTSLRIGSGSPEGAVTANQGSLYLRYDGGVGTSLYVKETSGSATGWRAVGTEKVTAGGTLLDPTGARNVMVWRAPYACTVTNVRGHRKGGTGATINARLNQASNHLASALSLTSADTWMDGGAVQNTAYAAGDDLEIMLASVSGSPTEIVIQVDFTRP